MKIKPTTPRTRAISVSVRGVKVRYDPAKDANGLQLPDDLGRALVKTGHWSEVVEPTKRAYSPQKASTFVDKVEAESDDRLSE